MYSEIAYKILPTDQTCKAYSPKQQNVIKFNTEIKHT